MAVSIIRKRFAVSCPQCLLELEYDSEDVLYDKNKGPYIVCPVCNASVPHDPKHEILPPPQEKIPVSQGPDDPGNPYAKW